MKAVMLFLVMANSILALNDKSSYCPKVERIEIIVTGEPNLYYYRAQNDDGKVFVSGEYGGNENNGPAPALNLLNASYDENTKTLSCTYYAYSTYGYPILVNQGDY